MSKKGKRKEMIEGKKKRKSFRTEGEGTRTRGIYFICTYIFELSALLDWLVVEL